MLRSLLLPLVFLIAAPWAQAAGLGEITLHSRIGEPLRAELPIISLDDGTKLDAGCFSLAPLAGADFPVVTAARLRVVSVGTHQRLIISGLRPIDEPVFGINVRAGCGLDLHRDYLLLPPPPISDTLPGTLNASAEESPPTTRPTKRRRAARNLNPESSFGNAIAPQVVPTPTSPAEMPPPPPRKRARPAPTSTQDRIVLGLAPAIGSSDSGLAAVEQLDERMLKLETTLRLLNQEVEKLDTAIALRTESRAVQQQLQTLQAQEKSVTPGATVAPPLPTPAVQEEGGQNWLQLLLGVLLGGAVSAGVAHLVSRRGGNSRPFDAPPPRIVKPGRPRQP